MTNETNVIEVRIEHVRDLFSSLDPSPFGSRDLNEEAEEHIVGWAKELPSATPIKITVRLPEDQVREAKKIALGDAISHYFRDRARKYDRDLSEHFTHGWWYLGIGLPLLAVCLLASQFVSTVLGEGSVSRILRESLIIVGWVANWKPIETFLYGWLPIVRTRNLYRRLANARVVIVPSSTS